MDDLEEFCLTGESDAVQELLAGNREGVLAWRNGDDQTALILAAYNNSQECVHMLIDAGADLDVQDVYGDTALILTALHDNPDCVRILIDAGADVDFQNEGGNTALMEAARVGRNRCVQLLLANNADVDAQDHGGQTAMDVLFRDDTRAAIRDALAQRKRACAETSALLQADPFHLPRDLVCVVLRHAYACRDMHKRKRKRKRKD